MAYSEQRLAELDRKYTERLAQLETAVQKWGDAADRTKAMYGLDGRNAAKAAAILRGAALQDEQTADDYGGPVFLKALVDARRGDPQAGAYLKAVLGTSDATGQAIVPNNFVASLTEALATRNIFRELMNVVPGVRAAAIDIPYEATAVTAAIVQGAYGSNKDVRDQVFGTVTATLYTLAQIADVGNQLLRQSNGAAEASARRRLAESIGMAESQWVLNGSGSSQPLGILQALMNVGDIAANKYTLNSETRVAAVGNGIAKLEARGARCTGIVMHPHGQVGAQARDLARRVPAAGRSIRQPVRRVAPG